MAQGAAYKAVSKDIRWYYLTAADAPSLPADLAAANLIAVAANQFIHTTADPVVPATRGGGVTPPNIEWREHGATSVITAVDITPAPAADASTVELAWVADMTNTLHMTILTASANTHATLIADIQTTAGDGTRGNAAGNAEGTLACMVVQHADAPLTLPSGASPVQATTTFTVSSRSFIHYGEP